MNGDIVALIVGLVTGAVGISSALIAAWQAKKARESNHTIQVADRLTRADKTNQLLYLWNRQLVDQIYRGTPPPPAEPPDGLFE